MILLLARLIHLDFKKIYNYDNYNYGQNEDNVVCNVTDYIGNTSTAETIIIINKVDNALPIVVSLTSDKPFLNLSNSNNSETVTYSAVVTDNVALSTISFPGTSLQGNTGSTYTFTKTYNVDDFNIGNNIDELTLTVTDTANNVSSKSISLYINRSDDSGPVISNLVANPSTVNLTTSSQTKNRRYYCYRYR